MKIRLAIELRKILPRSEMLSAKKAIWRGRETSVIMRTKVMKISQFHLGAKKKG
jgi:hypothetical protein